MRSRSVNGFAFVAFSKDNNKNKTKRQQKQLQLKKKAVRKRHKIAKTEMQQAPPREREGET